MGRSCKKFVIWFLGSSPVIVLWAIVIGVVVLAVRIFGKKRRLKKTLTSINSNEESENE
jgi:hypothetical protein